MARKKSFLRKYKFDIIALLAIILFSGIYIFTNILRTMNGNATYWSNGTIITINNIALGISSVLIFGYVSAKILTKANKKGFDVWDTVVILLIIISFLAYWQTNSIRAEHGMDSYWSDPWVITINEFSDNLAGSLLMGYVIGVLINRKKN